MIEIIKGNLFNSKAQTLVNTVNCVGVMGKGIALEFKNRFPDMYEDYVIRCEKGEVKLGLPYLYKSFVPPWILNFPTKDHWRSLAKVEDIVNGLEYLLGHYRSWGIVSLAVPPLGTGQGQLEWRIVGPLLYKYLSRFAIPIELYAPFEVSDDELELSFLKTGVHPDQIPLKTPSLGRINAPWVALVEIVRRLRNQTYHWPVGRTSLQKMAFIANEQGLPLGLEFRRGSYGPYSPELKPSLTRLQNNGLISERRLGRMFEVQIGSTFNLAYQTHSSEIENWDSIINKVVDLFMRSNTRQVEIIATVIFVTKELREKNGTRPTERDVLLAVLEWKQRRRPPLDEEEIAGTVRGLAAQGWLDICPSPDLEIAEKDIQPI